MKKIFIIATISILLFSCAGKEGNVSIDQLIESKNLTELKNKRVAVQADLAKIDEALATLEKKKDEALVETIVVKDTVFNHYLEIQGNVDTK